MKYLRYLDSNNENCIGLIKDNELYKLNYLSIMDAANDFYVNDNVDIIEKVDSNSVKIISPVIPTKIVCVGLNYKDHAEELHMSLPDEPLLFMKASSTIIAHEDTIICPNQSSKVDYEAELAIVILDDIKKGQFSKDVKLGFTILNDVTARDLQQKDGQWTRAKNFDTFCPLGPYVVTDIDCDNLDIELKVNNAINQSSNTSNMIFSPIELVEYISSIMTLSKGDVIATGTPPGVGQLQKGDEVIITIENIGSLKNTVN